MNSILFRWLIISQSIRLMLQRLICYDWMYEVVQATLVFQRWPRLQSALINLFQTIIDSLQAANINIIDQYRNNMVIRGLFLIGCYNSNINILFINIYIGSMQRKPSSSLRQTRQTITQELAQEIAVKFIINTFEKQKQLQRRYYSLKMGYLYYLRSHNLTCLALNQQHSKQFQLFSQKINEYLPDELRLTSGQLQQILQDQLNIPVYGAIIRNSEKQYLFVQDKRTSKYGFCKGKIGQNQTPYQCLSRELLQQIGVRIKYIENKPFNVIKAHSVWYRFYNVTIDSNTLEYNKYCREQISCWKWISIEEIIKMMQRRQFNVPTYYTLDKFVYQCVQRQ